MNIEFILQHVPEIISIIVFLVGLFILLKSGQKEKAREKIYNLICEAEEYFGSGKGEQKLNWLLLELYRRYPWIKIIPQKDIIYIVEQAIKLSKDLASDGKINGK